MKKILILLFILIVRNVLAYDFHFESKLPAIDSSGYYRIQVTPEIFSKLENGLKDLRIVDEKASEIPYIVKDDNVNYDSKFREYEIVYKKSLPDSLTRIVIRNSNRDKIDNINLLIRNAEVTKKLKLSGSYDQSQWFVVKESETISSIMGEGDIAEMKIINFPLTDYEYYRIDISDKGSEPLNIVKAGFYMKEQKGGSFTKLKSSFQTSDSARQKATWIHVILNDTLVVDKIQLSISKPEFFLRPAEFIYDMKNYRSADLELNSKLPLSYEIGGMRLRDFWIKISNKDNQPLKVDSITCYQKNHYCIAKLEKNKEYAFRFGDSNLRQPEYDLRYFETNLPGEMKIIIPGEIKNVTPVNVNDNSNLYTIFTDKRFIWIALIIVMILLGIMSYRMINKIE